MANTWTSIVTQVTHAAAAKTYAQLYNAGTRVLRVYRVYVVNASLTASTPSANTFPIFQLGRITTAIQAAGSTTGCTTTAHDSTASALSSVTFNTNPTTAAPSAIFRRRLYSPDDYAASVMKIDNLQGMIPLSILWDGGYGDTNVEPITIIQNEGLILYSPASAAQGACDVIFEFTDSAT